MKTALTTNNTDAIAPYFPMYRELLTATHFARLKSAPPAKKGKPVPAEYLELTIERKILWSWIVDRYKFFKDQGKAFFDNQKDIAATCGVSESTVKRFLRELAEAGYIKTHQTRIGGHKSNSYEVLEELVLLTIKEDSKKAGNAKRNHVEAAPAPRVASDDFVEPYGDSHKPAGPDWTSEAIPYDDVPGFVVMKQDHDNDDSSTAIQDYLQNQELYGKKPSENGDQPQVIATHRVSDKSLLTADLPRKKYNRDGTVSDEMLSFCDLNSIRYYKKDEKHVFLVNGIECLVTASGFEDISLMPF